MDLLFEDSGDFDLTTIGLGIGHKSGKMSFCAKHDMILSGAKEVQKIMNELRIKHTFHLCDGDFVSKNSLILEVFSDAETLHKTWKISQNIFEYMSGIATYTSKIVQNARLAKPDITIATTRKNFPGAKKLMLQAVLDGGGSIHRLGLYDSILIFKQHLEFLNDEELNSSFKNLKSKFIEKKIIVEVDNCVDALKFCELGADVLQCEKMNLEKLQECVTLKNRFPSLLVSATGGIDIENAYEFAKTGVDFIVTSAPYHAKPADIKVEMKYE